jgi:hypothetical protein
MKKHKKVKATTGQNWGVRSTDKMDNGAERWVYGPTDHEAASKALEQMKAQEHSPFISYQLLTMEDIQQSTAPIWGLWLADRVVAKNCRWVFGPADINTVKFEQSKLEKRNYSPTVTYEILEFPW